MQPQVNFIPTGSPTASEGPPCDVECYKRNGVALLGWSYFWYPSDDTAKMNRSAAVDVYKEQLNPNRTGDQEPKREMYAGNGMDECTEDFAPTTSLANVSTIAIASEGWREARREWPDNFVAAWWAGGCPDDMFMSLMLDGTFDLAMVEGYTYCPGCGDWPKSADCCSNTGVQSYYSRLDTARERGFLNRTVLCFGWIIAKTESNPLGWTKHSLKAAMVDLRTKYPEMPGVLMCESQRLPCASCRGLEHSCVERRRYGCSDGNATCNSNGTAGPGHTCACKEPETQALTLEANLLMRELWPDPD